MEEMKKFIFKIAQKIADKLGLPMDKLLHTAALYISLGLAYLAIVYLPLIVILILFGIYISVEKEYADAQDNDNYWSWGDLVADGIGIVLFIITYYLIYLIF